MIIYRIIRKSNWKGYTGQTVRPLEERVKAHYRDRRNTPIGNALKKDGLDGFFWYVVCYCSSKEEMDEKEKYYIKYFGDKKPDGYNLTEGGEGNLGWVPAEKTLEKMKKPKSIQHRANMSKGQIEFHMKNPGFQAGKNNPMYGRGRPDMMGENNPAKRPEVRVKISKERKSRGRRLVLWA
jgi:group I intron endonuclease